MLPDRSRELLTAFLDGELSARRRRQVVRLLQRSEEARRLLRQLEQDARRLRDLPPPRLEADLAPDVLRAIAARGLKPGSRRPFPVRSSLPSWLGLAAAAAVLLLLGTTSYLYFAAALRPAAAPAVAQHDADPAPPPPKPPEPDDALPEVRPPAPAPRVEPPPARPAVPVVPRRPVVSPPVRKPSPRPATPPPPTVITDRAGDALRIETAEVALPAIFRLADLGQPAGRRKLLAEMGKETGFRLELPCTDATRAFQRLRPALRGQRVELTVDPFAQARLKKPQWKTSYAVYVEDLTAEDWARLLHQLAGAERAGAGRRPPDVRFQGELVVSPLSHQDQRELIDLLGVDPTRHAPARSTGPLGTDPRKSLTEQTADHVARALAGQGTPRPRPGQSVASRSGLVLTYGPLRGPVSPEVRRFLEARKPHRPGTLRILLVLRHLGL